MQRFRTLLADYWFPFTLTALFLLALPGLILTFMGLFGQHAEVNHWLESNVGISFPMNLPLPWTVGLLLLPAFLIILYFLKLKRKPIHVPSTFLWKKSIEDVHVNSLFQWLRKNILLVLQLLTLLFFIYAVLGLRLHGSTSHGRHYILMLDNSASMNAADVSPSRLEWARQAALKEIDAASDDDWGMVIVFNSKATTLQAYTNNKGKLREAVRSIEPTFRTSQIEEALTLAASLANPERSTEDIASQPEGVGIEQKRTLVPTKGISTTVHLFSDGRFAKLSESSILGLKAGQQGMTSLLGNLNLHYHRAGLSAKDPVDNVGIVAFNAIRFVDPRQVNRLSDTQKLQVIARVNNYRPDPVKIKLKLDVQVDGQLFHREVGNVGEIPPRKIKANETGEIDDDTPGKGEISFLLPAIDLSKNVVMHGVLEEHRDALALDDEAWIAVGMVRKAKVLVVGPSNTVLDAFFDQEGTRRLASMERITLEQLGTDVYKDRTRGGDIDLVIFDGCAPADEADMPLANTFFLGSVPPPWKKTEAVLKSPLVLPSKKDHPLLKHLTTLWDVGVSEAFVFDVRKNLPDGGKAADAEKKILPSVTRILETTGQIPLMFSLNRGPFTDLIQVFSLMNDKGDLVSNWPLQTSYPLFMRNLLFHLANVDDSVKSVTVQPGETMVLRPEAGAKWLAVTTPSGSAAKLERGLRPDFNFAQTDAMGIYTYKVEGKEGSVRGFAVNLLDPNESLIEPREAIYIGSEKIAQGEERPVPRDVWKWLLLIALALLSIEWWIYTRRISI